MNQLPKSSRNTCPLFGIEILNASAFIQEAVLDTGFAKGLSLANIQTS